jgi:16S rRNA (cytosine967-C5)-methyltransferase
VAAAAPGLSPARVLAFEVVRRVFEQGAWADRVLAARAGTLAPRDRALATALAYGTVQRRATLDHVAARLVDRPLERLEPAVLAGLRLGLFQLLYLGGVADHAAVNETVGLVKTASRGGAGLVNAVLRRAAREGAGLVAGLGDETPEAAALAHSVPEWLAQLWWAELGAQRTRALLAAVNRPAESALRVNALRATPEQVLAALPVAARPAPGLPEGLVLEGPFDAHGSGLWADGALMPQSRGSMLVARALDPPAGATVLDLCAAPGAKTTHLAALGAGRVVAVERHAGRARALAATCARMGAEAIDVVVADAAAAAAPGAPAALRPPGGFDAVLVDPPCSGLGTVQSRPDLRWHADPAQIARLAELQGQILAAGAALARPGAALVYSVCTITAAEGPRVIERFLAAQPGWRAEALAERHPDYAEAATGPYLQLLPDREGTDGFFIARLSRVRE